MKTYKAKTKTKPTHTTNPNALRLVAATAALGCMVLGLGAQITNATIDTPVEHYILNTVEPATVDLCSLDVVGCKLTDAAKPIPPKQTTNAPVSHDYVGAFQKACNGESACVRVLTAIATVETGLNPYAVGDGGHSYGLFQIHRGYHPDISIAQAQDPLWSATWTINRLRYYGWPTYASNAIMHHNGTPGTAKTLAYLARVNAVLTKK